jgi:hypothetical protein
MLAHHVLPAAAAGVVLVVVVVLIVVVAVVVVVVLVVAVRVGNIFFTGAIPLAAGRGRQIFRNQITNQNIPITN